MRLRERVAAVGLLSLAGLGSAAPAMAACTSPSAPAPDSSAAVCDTDVLGTESSRSPGTTVEATEATRPTISRGRGSGGGLLPQTGTDALVLLLVGGAVTGTGALLVTVGRRSRDSSSGGTLGLVIAGGLLTLSGAGAVLDAGPASAGEVTATCTPGATPGGPPASSSCGPTPSRTAPAPSSTPSEPRFVESSDPPPPRDPDDPDPVVPEVPYALVLPLAGGIVVVTVAGLRARRAGS